MGICTEKPDVPLDIIGRDGYQPTHGGPDRHNTTSTALSSRTVTGSDMPFGRPNTTTPASIQGVPGSNRTRTKRGGARNKSKTVDAINAFGSQDPEGQVAKLEPVPPLVVLANRSTEKSPDDEEQNVERRVKGLLNKLTMEKFDSISDQIIEFANKSEAEKDCRTLIRVVRVIFENATQSPWSEMYARLCKKMTTTISPKVQDDGVRSANGKPITGGQLFRKYLLNRCKAGFEGYPDEYQTTQKAKRQGPYLSQFTGELYKLQMLTERIMHEYIKKHLGNVDVPEERIVSLCRLLTTVGKPLDSPKARARMDIYFRRIKKLRESSDIGPRMQFILQVGSTVCVLQ